MSTIDTPALVAENVPAVVATTQAVNLPSGAGPIRSVSLFVGDLAQTVDEAVLFDVFNRVGPVASVRICRDSITRRSLGYGYVNYQNPGDAERALETMNFAEIADQPCRIMWAQRDPSLRRSGAGNVFIKGLEKSIDAKALHDAFSIFGDILSVKIVKDPKTGESAGRGFVHFSKQEEANTAVEKTNGSVLKGSTVTVAHFKSRNERIAEQGSRIATFNNVFIKNFGETLNEADLKNKFSSFGNTTSIYVGRDETGKIRGFGFVCFEKPEDAKRAVEELDGSEIQVGDATQKLFVGRAMTKAERSRQKEAQRQERRKNFKGVNLYVKNFDETVDDEKLRGTFAEFGTILSHRVMRDEKGASRGFGFVCFTNQEEATRAITELNSRIILGTKPIYVALYQPKDERRAALSANLRFRNQYVGGQQMMYPPMFPGQQQMFYGMAPAYGQRPLFSQQQGGRYGGSRFQSPQQPGFNTAGRPQGPRQGQYRNQAFPPQGYVPQQGFAQQAFQQQQGFPQQGFPPHGVPSQQGFPQNRRYAQPQQPAQPEQVPASSNLASLANAPPEQQKQILGDSLYPRIANQFPEQAGKLTGMILQMDNSEIIHLLEDQNAFQQELNKAFEILRNAGGQA